MEANWMNWLERIDWESWKISRWEIKMVLPCELIQLELALLDCWQTRENSAMSMMEIRDVKRLYLSENSIPSSFPSVSFYNLIYLELAMCQLETLPANLSSLIPNVRFINLNYNFIHELTPLIGLERLKKIEVVGNRLKSFRGIVEVVKTWKEIESIDFRFVPFLAHALWFDWLTNFIQIEWIQQRCNSIHQ